MKKRVVIFGATGMLGAGVYAALKDHCTLKLVARNWDRLALLNDEYGPFSNSTDELVFTDYADKEPFDFERSLGDPDLVINCIGLLQKGPHGEYSPSEYTKINIDLPKILSDQYEGKLIHVSTDCVFNGGSGGYLENSPPNPSYGLYGYSKLFGESIQDKSIVLRCCLIGESLAGIGTGLLDWARNQTGDINGWTKAYASMITSVQFGKICLDILNDKTFPTNGLFHIESERMSKFDILKMYKEINNLKYNLIPDKSQTLDKSLKTLHNFNMLKAPSMQTMLSELREVHKVHK